MECSCFATKDTEQSRGSCRRSSIKKTFSFFLSETILLYIDENNAKGAEKAMMQERKWKVAGGTCF